MTKILLVDDDAHIRELVSISLIDEGFQVIEKADGSAAYQYFINHPVDLVILDIMMPYMDGWDLCNHIRQQADLPILILTAKSELAQKIKGFRLGTDDYMTKPFDPTELVMRVKALLRRYHIAVTQIVHIGDIQLDQSNYQLYCKDTRQSYTLPRKEFELFYQLARFPGQLFTRDMLIEKVWGFDYTGDMRTVDVHIKRLRDRLHTYHHQFKIVTLRGLGYRLEVYDE